MLLGVMRLFQAARASVAAATAELADILKRCDTAMVGSDWHAVRRSLEFHNVESGATNFSNGLALNRHVQ